MRIRYKWYSLLISLGLILALLVFPTAQVSVQASPEAELAFVTRVIDGDTIEVEIDGQEYDVRYIGIDTPERGQSCYQEASNANERLVKGRLVTLERDVSETGPYDRLLRYVYVDGIFVNAELVRQGYAKVATYPPDVKYEDIFLQLQHEAREAGRRLWAAEPCKLGQGEYVGSKKSDVYHQPSCHYVPRIKPENEIWFDSARAAVLAGYRACKVCKPPTWPTVQKLHKDLNRVTYKGETMEVDDAVHSLRPGVLWAMWHFASQRNEWEVYVPWAPPYASDLSLAVTGQLYVLAVSQDCIWTY